MRRNVTAGLAIGFSFILAGQAMTDRQLHWLDRDHGHTELPEGTTHHFSYRIAVDSSMNARGMLNLPPLGLRQVIPFAA
jgi:hypothetical protein